MAGVGLDGSPPWPRQLAAQLAGLAVRRWSDRADHPVVGARPDRGPTLPMEEPVTVANALSGTVALSEAEFKALPNYSCSLPTGTIIGKRWRRREPYENGPPGTVHTWFMGEYVESDREGYVSVRWYRIQILTAREEQVR